MEDVGSGKLPPARRNHTTTLATAYRLVSKGQKRPWRLKSDAGRQSPFP